MAWVVALACVAACDDGSAAAPAARREVEPSSMVAVPAATFEMGCRPERDPGCGPDEQPAHEVYVRRFRIDRTEVTQASYLACVLARRCSRPASGFDPERHPRRPVTQVTWRQARAFCRWLRKRLPSEAEWELAARGTDGRLYPWGDEPPTCERARTHECGDPDDVGLRPRGASPFGALDLAGNVDEWVEDRYARYGGRRAGSEQRVARGGAWDAWHSRSSARSALDPGYHDALVGFRCATGD